MAAGAIGSGARRDRRRPGESEPLSVLVVDDSLVARTILSRAIQSSPALTLVAAARNVDQALSVLDRAAVDIILLDVEMPGTDGLTAMPELIARSHGARVLILSSLCETGAAAGVRALAAGAADTMLKPTAGGFGTRFTDRLVDAIQRIGRTEPRHEPAAHDAAAPHHQPRGLVSHAPLECVAVGASTGGIAALAAFFAALPLRCDLPILVTQHLPAPFMPIFAGQLADLAGRPCHVAEEGAQLMPGRIAIAPGDRHLRPVKINGRLRVRFTAEAVASGCLPSVDPMFESLAEAVGPGGLGVVLSGMGRDGAAGAERLVASGGEVIAQDSATSVVWGMPGAVTRAGLASLVAPPATLAERILARWGQR